MSDIETLMFVFDGGRSTRYHTVDTIKTQNIADHSFGVAWLCELLTQRTASKMLIMAAMTHDLAEHLVGDIPAPAKRGMGMRKQFAEYERRCLADADLAMYEGELSEGEKETLKLADTLEGLMFCLNERELGNDRLGHVFRNYLKYATDIINNPDSIESATMLPYSRQIAIDILHKIKSEWSRYG